jgi:hypothetical protein
MKTFEVSNATWYSHIHQKQKNQILVGEDASEFPRHFGDGFSSHTKPERINYEFLGNIQLANRAEGVHQVRDRFNLSENENVQFVKCL